MQKEGLRPNDPQEGAEGGGTPTDSALRPQLDYAVKSTLDFLKQS